MIGVYVITMDVDILTPNSWQAISNHQVADGLSQYKTVFPRHGDSHDKQYSDVIMGTMESQITSLTIVFSTINSGTHQRKYQSPAPLAFVWWIHQWPVNSLHNWPVTWKMFSFGDVIMDKRVLRPSYLKHGDTYTGKTTPLCRDGPMPTQIWL